MAESVRSYWSGFGISVFLIVERTVFGGKNVRYNTTITGAVNAWRHYRRPFPELPDEVPETTYAIRHGRIYRMPQINTTLSCINTLMIAFARLTVYCCY
jgi:hypothetical protein